MINLLPPELKEGYRFARRNVGLRKWLFYCVFALVGLVGITTYGMLTLHQSTKHYEQQISSTQQALKSANFDETQKQIKDISSSFKLVVQVLGNEVLFSDLFKQIGALIPANAKLTSQTISQNQSAIDISAKAKDYATATQIQVNLNDPSNKIFSKADIVSISCGSSQQGSDDTQQKYPCNVSIRALFAKNNPYLFVNSKGTQR